MFRRTSFSLFFKRNLAQFKATVFSNLHIRHINFFTFSQSRKALSPFCAIRVAFECLRCCFCLSWVVRKHYPDGLFCCCYFKIESSSLGPLLGVLKNKYNFEPTVVAGERAPKPIMSFNGQWNATVSPALHRRAGAFYNNVLYNDVGFTV